MKRLILAIPSSHAVFWLQSCIAALLRHPPKVDGIECQIVVVDNSWNWASAGMILKETTLGKHVTIVDNQKSNKFHASGLDYIVETMEFDYLMAWETDVLALRDNWLPWFLSQLKERDFGVGHWHHESFINPSCTLYRGDVLREMSAWCKGNKEPDIMRWGTNWESTKKISDREPAHDYVLWFNDNIEWVAGPFAEKRGFPQGTIMAETPSGQMKGSGWFEPGQQLHHWATNRGWTYTVCNSHTFHLEPGLPVQTLYGDAVHNRELNFFDLEKSGAYTVHLWGGTRALDIIKHDVTCNFVKSHTPYWLGREARFWADSVPADVQAKTLELIRQHGFHLKSIDGRETTERDRQAYAFVRECYAKAGVTW